MDNEEARGKIVDHLAGGVFWFLNDEEEEEATQEDLLMDCQDLTWVVWDSLKPEVLEIQDENTFVVKITTDIPNVVKHMQSKLEK
jgi:hypothetical protein